MGSARSDALLGIDASRFGVWANFGFGFTDLRLSVKSSGQVFAILVRASRIWCLLVWASRIGFEVCGLGFEDLASYVKT